MPRTKYCPTCQQPMMDSKGRRARDYKRVAEVYTKAIKAGRSGPQAVAAAFNIDVSVANVMIHRARSRGLITIYSAANGRRPDSTYGYVR